MIETYEIKDNPNNQEISPKQALILRRGSVLVIRASHEMYNLEDLNTLRDYYQRIFPSNPVCVMWDDIDIDIIHDQTQRKERPCAEIPYDEYPSY